MRNDDDRAMMIAGVMLKSQPSDEDARGYLRTRVPSLVRCVGPNDLLTEFAVDTINHLDVGSRLEARRELEKDARSPNEEVSARAKLALTRIPKE